MNEVARPPAEAAEHQVAVSVRKYRRAHRRYEQRHPEIFNPVEQERLAAELRRAAGDVATRSAPLRALDFGCGSGNVTRHLLALRMDVTAADVSPQFLDLIARRFAGRTVRTLLLDGRDLAPLATGSLDFAAAYSVLHHVPDYLLAVEELCRVLRPGGVLYLDHEANPNFWDRSSCFWEFTAEVERRRRAGAGWWDPDGRRWQRFLSPRRYYARLRRAIDPAYPWNVEGDIHVWESDHIEWPAIEARIEAAGCEVLRRRDYLAYSADQSREVWERFRRDCSNMRLLVARRAT